MRVELPFAPVDSIIRREAGDLRVSADAAEALAKHIQSRGASLAADAAERAAADGRKTLMVEDFDVRDRPDSDGLTLPIAPIDRIARLAISDRYRVSEDARVALAGLLEREAAEIADGALQLAEHAGRRTIQAEDIDLYVRLVG